MKRTYSLIVIAIYTFHVLCAQVEGIEPSFAGLEAAVLPLHYTHMVVSNGLEPFLKPYESFVSTCCDTMESPVRF